MLFHSRSAALLFLGLSAVAGCTRVVVVPEPTAEDRAIARLAMKIEDVSLRARSGDKETVILGEIRKRHVARKLDAATEEGLIRSGITPVLIAALKDEANVLTEPQRKAFAEFAADRSVRSAEEKASAQQRVFELENQRVQDQQRSRMLAAQMQQNMRTSGSRERDYEEADRAYKARKASLEQQNIALQGSINRLRGYGYHEAEVNGYVAQIDRNKDELRNLKSPMR